MALLSVSSGLALIAAEIALRIVLDPAPEKLEPQVLYSRYDVDPAVGRTARYWLLSEDQRGTMAYSHDAAVEVNALGMRGPAPQDPRPPGRSRIVAVGDSMTFGVGVTEQHTWPAQLRARLASHGHDVEVLNAGMPGLDIAQEFSLLLERVVPLEPDLVVLGYYWNDMPVFAEPTAPWTPGDVVIVDSMVPSARFAQYAREAAKPRPWSDGLKDILRSSYLLHFVAQKIPTTQHLFFPSKVTLWRRAILQDERSERIDRCWGFVQQQLAQFRDVGREHGFDVVVVPLPIFEQLVSSSEPDTNGYQGRLAAICGELEIALVDPFAEIRALEPSYPADFVPFDGHPTDRIYGAVADRLAQWLVSQPEQLQSR